MVSIQDQSLRKGGSRLQQSIWDAARETLGAWTGQELTACSLYGIRIYQEGAILASHVGKYASAKNSNNVRLQIELSNPWRHDPKKF